MFLRKLKRERERYGTLEQGMEVNLFSYMNNAHLVIALKALAETSRILDSRIKKNFFLNYT